MGQPLGIEQLFTPCNTELFEFETTQELQSKEGALKHPRVYDALKSGAGIEQAGYNLFVMGPSGSGRHRLTEKLLREQALEKQVPSDLCYVYNFDDPDKPVALQLQAGRGEELKKDMKELVEHLKKVIPAMFKSDEYFFKKRDIDEWLKHKQEDAFFEISKEAKEDGIFVQYTPQGYTISPMSEDKTLTTQQYQALSEEQKEEIKQKIQKYRDKIDTVSQQVIAWNNEAYEKLQELEKGISKKAVGQSLQRLMEKYAAYAKVVSYLEAVEKDVLDNAQDFIDDNGNNTTQMLQSLFPSSYGGTPSFDIYDVNVLVDNSQQTAAPIVYEDNPTYNNLFGVVEYVSQMGTLVTDFNYIKPGALHKANGGYLVLDARKVLWQPYVWEGLKRMLFSGEIKIDTLANELGFGSTVTLEPEKVELDLKVVLIGERNLYYLLHHYDPEFQKLFKINADFEDEVVRDEDNTRLYAAMIAQMAHQNGLRPLDREAVAAVVEYGAKVAGSAYKLTTQVSHLLDLLQEANYLAAKEGDGQITKAFIAQALKQQQNRSNRIQHKIYEAIEEETILIDTHGFVSGQINGMSVVDLGDMRFGEPTKITALSRLGKGDVVDIEREVDLGGPIHSKGVMTLSAYLGYTYAQHLHLSIHATLSFEQSYGQVEGDSASAAELYALLSSLADIPIDQSFAVTGSINQKGQIQAVGGINEKIEGFFDVCQRCDSDNAHAVIIPKANVKHLMLKQDVLDAVAKGRFAVYAIGHVQEGIELLTGKTAGKALENGEFEKGSFNAAVQAKLRLFAQKAQQKKF